MTRPTQDDLGLRVGARASSSGHRNGSGSQPLPEAFVAWVWERRRYRAPLATADGRRVQVIYPGRRFGASGPDFHGALLAIDGDIVRGDVEVHVRARDWHFHGHASDPAYISTALHVVFQGEPTFPCLRADGAEVPTCALAPSLDTPLEVLIEEWRGAPGAALVVDPCSTPEEAARLLDEAGLERFRGKVARFEGDLTCVDASQALWRGLLECLGYACNATPFRELADRVPAAEARALAARGPSLLLATLFGRGGLLSSQRGFLPLDHYSQHLEGVWGALEDREGGQPLGWTWKGCRPGNGPPRRTAAAAALAEVIGSVGDVVTLTLSELSPRGAGLALGAMLMRPGDAYWQCHGDFGRPLRSPMRVLGPGRAADAVVNVLLPWAAATAEHRGDRAGAAAAEAAYLAHPPLAPNQITRHMARQVAGGAADRVVTTAARQQGLIAVYRGWCDARDCAACPAGGTSGMLESGRLGGGLLSSRTTPTGAATRAPVPTTGSAGRPSKRRATRGAVSSTR